jgi:hypothetical protein
MNHFIYFVNNSSPTGNPNIPQHYYNYLNSVWKNGLLMTYGGSGYGGITPANYMFPDDTDPLDPTPWNEVIENHPPSDRRGVGSSGRFTFSPGEELCLDYAYVFGNGTGGPMSGVSALKTNADSAHAFYASMTPCACTTYPVSVNENAAESFAVYPNPANDNITILWNTQNANASVQIIDITGRIVHTQPLAKAATVISMTDLSPGVYLVRIVDGPQTSTSKLLKQ